jgi:hypothetical protein
VIERLLVQIPDRDSELNILFAPKAAIIGRKRERL